MIISREQKQDTDGAFRYFCNPNFKSQIDAIPGTYSAEGEKKYKCVNTGDYLVQRLAATY